MRLGYLMGPAALIAEIDKVRPPYNVSVLNCECARFALAHAAVFEAQGASVASWIGSQEATYGEIKSPEDVMELIDAVTVEDVQEVASEILRSDRLNLTLIGPYDNDGTFADLLAFR